MKVFGLAWGRMCGGAFLRGGALLRRTPGGLVSDWLGVGVWRASRVAADSAAAEARARRELDAMRERWTSAATEVAHLRAVLDGDPVAVQVQARRAAVAAALVEELSAGG